ncbi:MAG TPA: nucleotidyltransferase family protein [Dictyobacter sp.]|jgi:molybdenum cofactor cytidylyltransferase|nr:nucleotidyltransferase family protein [Dictyobacter sp.]
MSEQQHIAAIILAAGRSSRMRDGQQKLLLPLGDRPVITHVLQNTLASQAQPILVVLGHQQQQLREQLAPYLTQPRISLLTNAEYSQGMSTSLRTGIEALLSMHRTTSIAGAMILLGDQPLMTSVIIDMLIATKHTTAARIVAPLYHGKRGNPVIFDTSLFPELLEITGDEGGRRIIERHKTEIATCPLPDAQAQYDVDTWDAYQHVVELWQKNHTEEAH